MNTDDVYILAWAALLATLPQPFVELVEEPDPQPDYALLNVGGTIVRVTLTIVE